eukprot:1156208-Pelagomonas_calceolata.AAC.1
MMKSNSQVLQVKVRLLRRNCSTVVHKLVMLLDSQSSSSLNILLPICNVRGLGTFCAMSISKTSAFRGEAVQLWNFDVEEREWWWGGGGRRKQNPWTGKCLNWEFLNCHDDGESARV